MKRICLLAILPLLVLSCEKKGEQTPQEGPLPQSLEIYGEGIEYGVAGAAMRKAGEGLWEIYASFNEGANLTIEEPGGEKQLSFDAPKSGPCRLRYDAKAKAYEFVKINKVSLVVTEGGVEDPDKGYKPPIEANYEGGGKWTVEELYVVTDHIRYRFLLETDDPSALKYWCATWDNAGSAPERLTADYLKVRALGEDEYNSLYLKENRACWMFPQDRTLLMAEFTVSMNTASQEVKFDSPHSGHYAAFMGDSITWQWARTSRTDDKSAIKIPLDPLPSFMTISGDKVTTYFHPQFFTEHNFLNVGISAQNTTQMLARFQTDVINDDPHCVVIMAGTNDLAQGRTHDEILANLTAMSEMAEEKGIPVILCSITPCNANPNTKGAKIIILNNKIKAYAASKGFLWCDYFPCLVDEDGVSMQRKFWLYDDLHPNPDGYTEMEKVILPIISNLLSSRGINDLTN